MRILPQLKINGERNRGRSAVKEMSEAQRQRGAEGNAANAEGLPAPDCAPGPHPVTPRAPLQPNPSSAGLKPARAGDVHA